MSSPETIHRYPRLLTWSIEILCTAVVLLSVVRLGAVVLRYLWDTFGIDSAMFQWLPFLPDVLSWLNTLADRPRSETLIDLIPVLGWTAVALLFAILLRNALPAVRTSSRGMLVEFGGDWIPVAWEDVRAIKVTSDASTERFVLLVQSTKQRMTDWHRFYSLVYNIGWRRGLWITSNISDFDQVVRTILAETDRAARADENVAPVRLDEEHQSLLFRLLLNPVSFFSRRTPDEQAVDNVATFAPEPQPRTIERSLSTDPPERGTYPRRINAVFPWVALVLLVLMVWRYLVYWGQFLALMFPALRDITPFDRVLSRAAYADIANYYATGPVPFFGVSTLPNLPAPWWLLIAMHLMVVLVIGILGVLRNLLPALESRPEGLAVQVKQAVLGRPYWHVVPWDRITAVKATEFSEENQMLLFQMRDNSLPRSFRFVSLLYDGSFKPSVLVTSAMSNYEPVMQRTLTEVTQRQPVPVASGGMMEEDEADTILQQDAHSLLLRLGFQPGATIDHLVEEARTDINTKDLGSGAWRRALMPMVLVAILPAVFLLLDTLLVRGLPPGFGMVLRFGLLWFIGMLEWPLICLVSVLLDDSTGGGEEGYRAFPLYPLVQLPRLVPLAGGMVFLIAGVPVVALLGWVGAIIFSFFLSAGLWEKLYGWKGSQAILGGLIPVIWQLLVLLAYVIVQR